MGEVFRTDPLSVAGEAGTGLVVHCSDPRFQPHFHDFLRRALRLERYALLAVPGGAQFLTLVDYLPKFSWAGWRWVKFIGDIAPPSRVVLIAHDDCLWYKHVRGRSKLGEIHAKQLEDLRRVEAGVRERFRNVAVELYFARLEGNSATFESVR
jgi:hypothetical protein